MPTTWVKPEIAVEHNDVTVYHTYKDGQYRSAYWYTVHESFDDWEDGAAFDVRDLDFEGETHEEILKAAIDAGDPRVCHASDCSQDCERMPDGKLACATPISEV